MELIGKCLTSLQSDAIHLACHKWIAVKEMNVRNHEENESRNILAIPTWLNNPSDN